MLEWDAQDLIVAKNDKKNQLKKFKEIIKTKILNFK
jgi:hypothetical protein